MASHRFEIDACAGLAREAILDGRAMLLVRVRLFDGPGVVDGLTAIHFSPGLDSPQFLGSRARAPTTALRAAVDEGRRQFARRQDDGRSVATGTGPAKGRELTRREQPYLARRSREPDKNLRRSRLRLHKQQPYYQACLLAGRGPGI